MASNMEVLHGNDAFSILVLSTKKPYSSFGKGFAFSRKSASKLKYWKLGQVSRILITKRYNILELCNDTVQARFSSSNVVLDI